MKSFPALQMQVLTFASISTLFGQLEGKKITHHRRFYIIVIWYVFVSAMTL